MKTLYKKHIQHFCIEDGIVKIDPMFHFFQLNVLMIFIEVRLTYQLYKS